MEEKRILIIDPATIPCAVLQRIISEVQNEHYHPETKPSCYNRFHNRHFKSKAPLTKFQEEWNKKEE